MRILLISPHLSKGELRTDKMVAVYPPLGLCYLATILKKKGHKVKLLDAEVLRLTKQQIKNEVLSFKPDMVGITCVTIKYQQFKEVAEMIKEIDKDIYCVGGGPHTSIRPKETMEEIPSFDAVCVGEAEETWPELIEYIEKKLPFKDVLGVVHRNKEGSVVINPPRAPIKDLDSIPYPDLDFMEDLNLYGFNFRYKRLPALNMITSRGCPYRCTFCTDAQSNYRFNSADYVVGLTEHLIENHGVKELYYVDDIFLLPPKRATDILDKFVDRGIDLTWSCNARIDVLYKSRELIKKAKKAGCWFMSFGIESGDQRMLDFLKKDQTTEMIREVVTDVSKAGIFAKGYFMIGMPKDNPQSLRNTINFAKSLPLGSAQFSTIVPTIGTELYDYVQENDKDRYNEGEWENFSGHTSNPTYINENFTKESLLKWQKRAYREFYFRPNYLFNQLKTIGNFEDLKRYSIGFWHKMRFQFNKINAI